MTDRIFVKNLGSSTDHWFEGHVHRVHEKDVDLRFSDRFNSFKGQKYNVRFDLNRITYKRMHQALDTAFNPKRILFPGAEHVANLKPPTQAQKDTLRLIDRKIADNPPQLEAIAAIVNRPPGSIPFVVFGPYVTYSIMCRILISSVCSDLEQARPSQLWKQYGKF